MTDDVLTEEVDEVDEWVFVCPWCQRSNDIHDAQCIMSDTEEFDLDSDSE